MKEQEALEKVCEMIEKEGIWEVEKKLMETLKKYYHVEDLYFYKSNGWTYASETDPRRRGLWGISDYEELNFHDLCFALFDCSRIIVNGGERLLGSDLKERGLIKKLAGI